MEMTEPFYVQSSQKVKQTDIEILTSKLHNKIKFLTTLGNVSEEDIKNILYDYSQRLLQITGSGKLLNEAAASSFLKILMDRNMPDPYLELLPLNDSFLGLEIPATRVLLNHRPKNRNFFSKPRILFVGTQASNPQLNYIETERHNVSRLSQNYFVEYYEETDSIDDLIKKINRADAVHFCGHSFIKNGEPVFQLNGSKKIYLNGTQIKETLKTPPAIIWMNSCQSCGNKDHLGWAEIFLDLGASTFIGYKIYINDKYAYDASFIFYYSMYIGENAGEALLKAKRNLSKNGSVNWIYMIMYGDNEQKITLN